MDCTKVEKACEESPESRPDGPAEACRRSSIHAVIAGALFDFIGYLTTRPEPLTVGSSSECTPALELLEAWAGDRGLELDYAAVQGWTGALNPFQLHKEVDRLSSFIMENCPEEIGRGDPGGESAVDVAIRLLGDPEQLVKTRMYRSMGVPKKYLGKKPG